MLYPIELGVPVGTRMLRGQDRVSAFLITANDDPTPKFYGYESRLPSHRQKTSEICSASWGGTSGRTDWFASND
ncbi:hypothetical protein N9053_00990 [bacterium]|nr:hypothetical protein [bacterium]